MKYALTLFLASISAHAGAKFPISFTKSVCVSDYPSTLAALTEVNKRVSDELASCTAGVFEHSGSFLALDKITIETSFSHMCTGGDRVMTAAVSGSCVIP